MKNQKEIDNNQKNGGGVKSCKKKIISLLNQIDEERFLNQIYTILKKHIEKRGC